MHIYIPCHLDLNGGSSWTPTAARPWHEVFFCCLNALGLGWDMLTFLVSCTHAGCYAMEGLGLGVTSRVFPQDYRLFFSQFQWRRSIGSVCTAKFLQELSRVFAQHGRK